MNEPNSLSNKDWVRHAILLVALVFAITLAIMIANRLSNEAMAVLVGALCGISATLPVSLALMIAMNKNWGRTETRREEYAAHPTSPPVLVIAPPQTAPWQASYPADQVYLPPHAPIAGAPREFKIVGD